MLHLEKETKSGDFFSLLPFGDYADLFWEESRTLAIRWEDGRVERFTSGEDHGAGLRYMVGEENRYGAIDNPTPDALKHLSGTLSGRDLPAGRQTLRRSS